MGTEDEVKVSGGQGGAEGYHVLKVQQKSPAAEAGLEAFFDFIVALNGTRLDRDNETQLGQILELHVDRRMRMTVYSCKSKLTRSIQITPSTQWGGPGLLGISVRFCSFQTPSDDNNWRILYVELNSSSPCHPKEEEGTDIPDQELSQGSTDSGIFLPSPTNTVGLQIDFEDPDIYYFAGGRHVALQTDNVNDEFGPLELFLPGPRPVPTVLSTTETTEPVEPVTVATSVPLPSSPVVTSVKSGQTPEPLVVRKVMSASPKVKTQSPLPLNFKPAVGLKRTIMVGQSTPGRLPPPTKVQVKDVAIPKKREIGEDGWETVRPRYNRSKWSLSSRSSSSSNNDLANGGAETKVSGDSEWKAVEDEHVAAEEEKIQEKEAALDSAIREEELIEQELLQVEKDFHQIENQTSVVMRTIATETDSLEMEIPLSPSPEDMREVDIVTEMDMEPPVEALKVEVNGVIDEDEHGEEVDEVDDDCFFIDIVGGHSLHKQPTEDFLAKETERIVALREKLMSPAKCRDSAETLRRHQAKLAKAEMNRERLLEAKYNRYVELSERFQTLNETTRRLVEERSELIAKAEERRKRAVEKRQQLLQDIKKKAHDEESKAKEIAFINLLETQIKRSGFLSSAHAKDLEVGGRLQSREEERKLKLEDRFVKLSAVLDRQSKIKRDWEAKLSAMQEKRRHTSERILREKQKRAKERTELAQEKARGREERISALNAAKQAKKEELKKSIQQKQQDTARRHEENMEQIRQKAIELSVPRIAEDAPIRICTLCKVVIESEVQELAHLRGRTHLDGVKRMEKEAPHSHQGGGGAENFGIKFIADVQVDKLEPGLTTDKNRLKVMKKHCKKLLQKLTLSGKEFEIRETPPALNGKQWKDQTTNKNKIQKNIREMDRLVNLFNSQRGSLHLATSLDRILGETRKAAVRSHFIQDSLIGMGLFPVLQKIFECKAPDLPQRVLIGACNLLVGATFRNLYNSVYVLRSSTICNILELSSRRWETLIPDGHRWLCASPLGQNEPLPVDPVIAALIELLSTVLNVVPDPFDGVTSQKQSFFKESDLTDLHARNLEVIGYIVGSGIVDRLSIYCSGVRGAIEGQQMVANLLKDSIDFLTMLVYSLQTSWDGKKPEVSQLLAALESSEIAGAVSMSYSLLLHQGAPTRPRVTLSDATVPPPPGLLSGSLVRSTLSLINAFAKLDLVGLQRVLGSEAVSLQFRHIASQLLWQVVPHAESETSWARLVHELLIALGHFTVGHSGNQATIQAGQTPTVLQQLCGLPQVYFDEPKLSRYLFPTLIAATFGCPENELILTQQNIPMELLNGFMKTDFAKLNPICKRLLPTTTTTTGSPPCMKSA